jgi:anti-sigma regulatory factor (Ser/Thr protein kinase)
VKHRPAIPMVNLVLDVEPSEAGIAAARFRVVQAITHLGLHESYCFSVELCVQEALVNALVHGVQERNGAKILLRCEIDFEGVRMSVEDDGPSIQADSEQSSGWGLLLIRAFMSRVSIEASGRRTCMELDFDNDLACSIHSKHRMNVYECAVHAPEFPSTAGEFYAD